MEIQVAPLNIKQYWPATEEEAAENKAELARYRKELGEKITSKAVLTPDSPTTFTSTFDGYGDSGQYHHEAGDEEVDALLSHMVYTVVTFDWYNNDGGGGDITWDVVSDVITINGYKSVITQEDVMSEVVF